MRMIKYGGTGVRFMMTEKVAGNIEVIVSSSFRTAWGVIKKSGKVCVSGLRQRKSFRYTACNFSLEMNEGNIFIMDERSLF